MIRVTALRFHRVVVELTYIGNHRHIWKSDRAELKQKYIGSVGRFIEAEEESRIRKWDGEKKRDESEGKKKPPAKTR